MTRSFDSQRPIRVGGRMWKIACLGTWLAVLSLLTFELWPRFQGAWGKTPWGREQPWQGGIEQFLERGSVLARRDLFHSAPRPKLDPRRMERPRTLLWIRDRVSGGLETRNSWPNALLVQALVEAGEVYTEDIERYWDELIDDSGRWREPPSLLSHCLVGMPLLTWYERTGQERYRMAAESLVDWLVQSHVRSVTGTLPYRPEEPNVLLVDTLGMICPLLARYGKDHSRPDAAALAKHQLLEFLDDAIDAPTGLPFHAYRVDVAERPEAFGLVGWGRGCGWLAVGLAGSLQWLATDDPDYPRLAGAMMDLLEAVRNHQREDGLWGWAINIPNATPDTSTTGMMAWSIRLGVEAGAIQGADLENVRQQAVQGILRYTSASGNVGQSMADAAGVGQYPWLFGHTTWTQALALLAVRDLP